MKWVALSAVAGALVGGCGPSSADQPTSPTVARERAPTVTSSTTGRAASMPRGGKATSAVCPPAAHALDGVYHPERLTVLSFCRHAAGRVTLVRHEEDGDLHIDVRVDPAYTGLLARANYSRQHGDLVVEFMARDGGHLPEPHVGDRISLTGAWVDDTQHAWNELHPVWALSLNGGATHTSGPRFGGSPAGDRSYNAAGDCRTSRGTRCTGYGTGSASDEGESPRRRRMAPSRSGSPGAGSSRTGCEPGYSPCLPRTSDLNCSDIPEAKKPVRVTGNDRYGLDRDHDGIGCQSG